MSQNYAKISQERAFLVQALQWHLDNGVDEVLLDQPVDRTVIPSLPKKQDLPAPSSMPKDIAAVKGAQKDVSLLTGLQDNSLQQSMGQTVEGDLLGTAQAIVEAQKLAQSCQTLDALRQAIEGFEGLSIRKNATNMVFSDGNPEANIMVIGEAPGADEDIQGKPFVGVSGQLLDRILACIDLSRGAEKASGAVYISNILNWRPPGNRTPTQAEMDISLPFIERHIALIQPKLLILCGGVAAKSLLRRTETISKLRGAFHPYQPSDGLSDAESNTIEAIATYHPAYILRTPSQKKAVWQDMLMVKEKIEPLKD